MSELDLTEPYEIVPDSLYASIFAGPATLQGEQPTRALVQLTDRLNGSESKLTYKQATILHGWLTVYLTRFPWRAAEIITDAEIERAKVDGEAAAAEAGERATKRRGGA